MPFGFSKAGFHYGAVSSVGFTSPYALINTMISSLRTNRDQLKNVNFYPYILDGDAFSILGTNPDMYDIGNYTTPGLRSGQIYTSDQSNRSSFFPRSVMYSATASSITDTDFYFASIGYSQQSPAQIATTTLAHPLTVIGARSGSGVTVGWQIGGNAGADGGGSIGTSFVYIGEIVNTFTTWAWYRQISGAGDPSICSLFLLLGHSNWNSVFGGISTFSGPTTDFCGAYLFTSGEGVKDILAIYSLLSRESGVAVTHGQLINIVNNYTSILKTALGY